MESKLINVDWAGSSRGVWVADQFDGFLDEFASAVGGQLTDERCPFGVLLWPCARTMAQFMADDAALRAAEPELIVELGCGVGFISCVLATLYPRAQILACDYEPGLEAMVARNAASWGVAARVSFEKIDWRAPVPDTLKSRADLVVGTDVFYDDSHIKHLPPFAAGLLRADGRMLLADPKRYRFGQALHILKDSFVLERHIELSCSMKQDGIEDFMINAGLEEQNISILDLRKK